MARSWLRSTYATRGLLLLSTSAGLAANGTAAVAANSCRLLQYAFEPDCLVRNATGSCHFDLAHPDLGPQIAVWVETADGSAFIDTVMVTNAVALHGIGNRPGRWDFRSGPRFPYGRRPMALPIWAHKRGVQYESVVMDDRHDDEMTSHEKVSSPEAFFCRPMMPSETLDAITCASGNFRSAKGIFDQTTSPSYYPPRGDLIDWGNNCIPHISIDGQACDYGDARQFGLINDLDVIATATPPYDQPFSATWSIPPGLPDGDYALMVEVSKEFDANASFSHTSFLTSYEAEFYGQYGLDGNVGQPSVVYRLDFRVSSDLVAPAAAVEPVGYGDWTGVSGDLTSIDTRVSDGPGTGGGRLRITYGAGGLGRVHLAGLPCAPLDCSVSPPPEPPRIDEPFGNQDPALVTFTFRQATDGGLPVIAYEMKYESDNQAQLDETNLDGWTPAPSPAVAAPGTITTVTLRGLTPQSGYAVALRTLGVCGWSTWAFIRFYVGPTNYLKLSGCVIATAAYGSDLHPDVALLRRERDWAADHSALARVAALLYARSAPPLAALVRRSDTLRAIVRSLLRPVIDVNRAAVTLVSNK